MDNEDKIKQLKAELFDILIHQESLVIQHQQVEKVKQEKFKELHELSQPPQNKTN